MRIFKLSLTCLFILSLPVALAAQNLFLQKVEPPFVKNYCVDCGEPKATPGQLALDYISDKINHRYSFKNGYGSLTFQVLVDSTGFSSVISHSDPTNSPLTYDLIRFLNGCLWRPARVNGKKVASSVNVVFNIANGGISARMLRMDLSEQAPAGSPTITNANFKYDNPSLNTYEFKVWTKYDSPLPDNIAHSCAIDKTDTLWYASIKGLTRFAGDNFLPVNEYNSPFAGEAPIHDIAIDNKNDRWFYAFNSIYKYNTGSWQTFDFKKFLVSGVNRILNSRNGELLLTTKEGLVVARENKIALLNRKTFLQMPSNDVYYAYDDGRKRLWIGTTSGSIMIDGLVVTAFNKGNTPLKNACISGVAEDERGNLYFSLLGNKNAQGVSTTDGLAVLTTSGKWLYYNDKNSGLPSNHINHILYDKFEHVLWIATAESGLVRFDLNNGWETYNNKNSAVPGYEIFQLALDSKGTLYAATANGLLRMVKKKQAL